MNRVILILLSTCLLLASCNKTTDAITAPPADAITTPPAEIIIAGQAYPNSITELDLTQSDFIDSEDLISISHMSELVTLSLNVDSLREDIFPLGIDLSPLSNLVNLKNLYISSPTDMIVDISPLAVLTRLENLTLSSRNLTDISSLAGLTDLQSLSVYASSELNDISALSNLTQLTSLSIERHFSEEPLDLSPLQNLTALTHLSFYRHRVGNLKPLAGLENLTELHLFEVGVTDIYPLKGLTKLKSLILTDNFDLEDISPLSGLTQLTELSVASANIRDSYHLEYLTQLETLNISGNPITNLHRLSGLSNLTDLQFSTYHRHGWEVKSYLVAIYPLNKLTSLTYLDLRGHDFPLADINVLLEALPGCEIHIRIPPNENGFAYEVNDAGIKIAHVDKHSETAIIVPANIAGKPVHTIGEWAFYQHVSLETVTLPTTLTHIESVAFYRCYSMENIFIPAAVRFIDSDAFFRCSSLTAITVDPENECYTDIDGVLFSKDETKLITYPEAHPQEHYTIPTSVTEITGHEFGYQPSYLRELTILSNVLVFPDYNIFIFPDDIKLIVEAGSAAEEYARKHDLPLQVIGEE